MKGRVITVVSAKNGSGQTILATNLAVALSKKVNQRVALLDATAKSVSDISNLLNLAPEKSLTDLLPLIAQLEPQLLKGYLTSHSSGVDFLQLGSDSVSNVKLQPEHLKKIVPYLTEIYPYTIIDCEHNFTETNLSFFDLSNLILLILTPDIISFNHTKHCIEKFRQLHYPLSLIKLILNMDMVSNALPSEKIESFLKQTLFFKTPYDPETIIYSINQGSPALLNNQRAPFSKAIVQLVELLTSKDDLYLTSVNPVLMNRRTVDKVSSHIKSNDTVPFSEAKNSVSVVMDTEKIAALKNDLHKKLLQELDLRTLNLKSTETRELVKQTLQRIFADEQTTLSLRDQRTQLVNEMLDEVLGLGPLEPFLRDPSISEIMTIGMDKIYIERAGKIVLTGAKFVNEQQVMTIIERIVSPIGRRIDESMPLCDARLKDGSRVNIVIPPLALD